MSGDYELAGLCSNAARLIIAPNGHHHVAVRPAQEFFSPRAGFRQRRVNSKETYLVRWVRHGSDRDPLALSWKDPTELAINQPGDQFEQEADHLSGRITSPLPHHGLTAGSTQLKAAGVSGPKTGEIQATPEVGQALTSRGQSLDPKTRAFMESRFQFDFGRVRVHHDEAASRAATELSAHAFTVGSQVVFGRDQYAPETAAGRKLLAHELTHVVQQTQAGSRLIQRDPILKGKSQHEFGDRDAPTIDKAIAASPITNWVPAKSLTKLAGNVDTEDPVVFEQQFKTFGKSNENVDEVPGFVDRTQKKPIKLRLPGKNTAGQLVTAAKFEAAVHETVHLNSNVWFQNTFGHSYNEGVTEYFTEMVLGEAGKAYRDRLKLAEGLVAVLGEDDVGKSYFQANKAPYGRIIKALGQLPSKTGFSDWHKAREKEPPDWQTANALLQSAFNASKQASTPSPAPTGKTTGQPSKTTTE